MKVYEFRIAAVFASDADEPDAQTAIAIRDVLREACDEEAIEPRMLIDSVTVERCC